MNSKFAYVTYIRTTPARLWEALTDPEFNRQFWRLADDPVEPQDAAGERRLGQ